MVVYPLCHCQCIKNLCGCFSDHQELFILYATVSILVGFILLLLVIIIRLALTRKRHKRRAKLDISEPIPQAGGLSSAAGRERTPDLPARGPEDEALLNAHDVTDSSGDGIEILSFNQHHSSFHRNNHYNTTPKTFGSHNNNNNATTATHSAAVARPYSSGSGTVTVTTASPFTNQYRTSPMRTSTLPRYDSQGSRTFDNYYR